MVRQYKIHTDMDNPMKNKTWDVTNGKLRFYEPTNLGIEVANNMWSTDGIGVLGARSVNQPNIEFKLETFGDNLEENYKLLTDFVNDLLSVRYVTLEYQTEWFQVFADVALSNVTKTEGYGCNGTFSETIEFEVVTKWYTFENLTFKTLQNGEIIQGVSKIYGGAKSANQLPNFNLEQHTRELIGTNNKLIWGSFASKTKTIAREEVHIAGLQNSTVGVHFTQVTSGQSGWRSPNAAGGGSIPVTAGDKYTLSAYVKNNGTEPLTINLTLGMSANQNQSSPTTPANYITIEPSEDFQLVSNTIEIPSGMAYAWCYVYTKPNTETADWSLAGLKLEKGDKRTMWLPTEDEMTDLDYAPYAGYRYIENKAYTYYGETDISRLSRWDIDKPFFSFIARLIPVQGLPQNQKYGLEFYNQNGNKYSAILFTFEKAPDQILINTDVNDEYYTAVRDGSLINAFPTLDFAAYRTRIFTEGQMTMQNISQVEIKVKRKVDFI